MKNLLIKKCKTSKTATWVVAIAGIVLMVGVVFWEALTLPLQIALAIILIFVGVLGL